MTDVMPVQTFQIGQRVQRVRPHVDGAFVIGVIYFTTDDRVLYASGAGYSAYEGDQLTLVPERKPYEPTERRVVTRTMKTTVSSIEYVNALYRPETDEEMGTRHTVERAAYDAREGGE